MTIYNAMARTIDACIRARRDDREGAGCLGADDDAYGAIIKIDLG